MYILEPLLRLIWPLPKICKAPEIDPEEVAKADEAWRTKRMRPFKRRGRAKESIPRGEQSEHDRYFGSLFR